MKNRSTHLADPARLAALHAVALLDTPTEESFDRLTWLAARFLQAPVALVSLVDADRQFFKSCIGLPEPWSSRRETPLSHSFCQHNRTAGRPLLIEDARANPLFKDNAAVRDLNVVAYLGIPLVTSDGYVLGSFCVIDSRPRQWTKEDVLVVQNLALAVMTEIQLRTEIAARHRSEKECEGLAQLNAGLLSEKLQALSARQNAILAAVPDIIMEVDSEMVYTWSNRAGREFFGDDVVGRTAASFFEDGEDTSARVRPLFDDTEGLISVDSRQRRKDGEVRLLSWRCKPLKDEQGRITGALSTARDITEHKRAEEALKESRSKLEAAMASMTDAVFICDNTNNFIEFNDAFALFHRFENKASSLRRREQFRALLEFFTPDGEPVPHEMWPVSRALRGETVTNAEYTLHRIDKDETTPIRLAQARPILQNQDLFANLRNRP